MEPRTIPIADRVLKFYFAWSMQFAKTLKKGDPLSICASLVMLGCFFDPTKGEDWVLGDEEGIYAYEIWLNKALKKRVLKLISRRKDLVLFAIREHMHSQLCDYNTPEMQAWVRKLERTIEAQPVT